MMVFVGLLHGVELLDQLLGGRLDANGILWAPLLHAGWMHLGANAVPLLVLGFMILLSGIRRWAAVTSVVWLVGGLGTWLTGGDRTLHLGTSGLVSAG